MKRTWTPLHILGMIIGGYVVLSEIVSNVEHIISISNTIFIPDVMIAVGVSVGTVFCFAMAVDAMEDWRKFSSWVNCLGLLAAFVFGAFFALSTTFSRVSEATDKKLQRIYKNDEQYVSLVNLHKNVSYMAARTCGTEKQKSNNKSHACVNISGEVDVASERIMQRQGELDPMGKRIAVLSNGYLSPHTASMLYPMFLPIAMFLMGTFMVGYGVKGRYVKPEFDIGLTGMAAKEDKARRFINEFRTANGQLPSVADVKRIAGVSEPTARNYLRKYGK